MSFKDYLPSKSFQKKLLSILVIVAVFFAIIFSIRLVKFLINKREINKQVKNLPVEIRDQASVLTIGELQKKDSNNNGIPDWEERLYGLNPSIDGENNKKIIEQKRFELKNDNVNNIDTNQNKDTDTARFAQQFLSVVLSLEGSNALTENALANVTAAAGDSLSEYQLPDVFSSWHVKTVDDSVISKDRYVNTLLTELIKITDQNGDNELNIIAKAIAEDKDAVDSLKFLSETYQKSVTNLKDIFVPKKLMSEHLAIINSLDHISVALDNMKYVSTDPARATKGILQYQVYSETLNNAISQIQNKY